MKINIANTEKLKKALHAVQKNARTRTLTVKELEHAVIDAERTMAAAGIPLQYRKGALVTIDMHRVPNSYRGRAYATLATAQRGTRGNWFITRISREPIGSVSFGCNTMPPHVSIPETPNLLRAVLRSRGVSIHHTTT